MGTSTVNFCAILLPFFLFPSDGRLFCTNRRGTIAVSISEMVLSPREFTRAPLRPNEENKTRETAKHRPSFWLPSFLLSPSVIQCMFIKRIFFINGEPF